ncbi:SPRY domain-containing SOCS box protein 3-like [Paramacrobiotus metropolitanus]|uniref:SPRY domain-containing SOCS box protein 3-like n=1 Tax=Paramacrobiotus metropolitanus TaxID=2943436 RepID=UPI002445FE50|nr:SPRY domain-containing SOCS box protein 3-like [Paramacrobiotus metropolitanus]
MAVQRFTYYIVRQDTIMDDVDDDISDPHLICASDTLEKVPLEISHIPSKCPLRNASPDCWQWHPPRSAQDVLLCDDRTVIFHPSWSNSTQAVRGTRQLNGQLCYWEVVFGSRVFGTAMMVGIGTADARTSSTVFEPLLGNDGESWGLCHKGFIHHQKQQRRYCDPFEENTPTVIGVLCNGMDGTVTFYKDGHSLGVAFQGVNECKKELYPMASSTAAKTVMHVRNMRRCFGGLQDRCRDVILRSVNEPADVMRLPLPYHLRAFVFQHAWKTVNKSCFVME